MLLHFIQIIASLHGSKVVGLPSLHHFWSWITYCKPSSASLTTNSTLYLANAALGQHCRQDLGDPLPAVVCHCPIDVTHPTLLSLPLLLAIKDGRW